jgi:hypothetical protein
VPTLRVCLFLLLVISDGGGILAVSASASDQTPAGSSEDAAPVFVFAQQAAGGTLAPTGADDWTLSLTGVFPRTVYFTDRPARMAARWRLPSC